MKVCLVKFPNSSIYLVLHYDYGDHMFVLGAVVADNSSGHLNSNVRIAIGKSDSVRKITYVGPVVSIEKFKSEDKKLIKANFFCYKCNDLEPFMDCDIINISHGLIVDCVSLYVEANILI